MHFQLSTTTQIEYLLIVALSRLIFMSHINDPPGEFHPSPLTGISHHLPLATVHHPLQCASKGHLVREKASEQHSNISVHGIKLQSDIFSNNLVIRLCA
jgi:hypothetical protein